MAVVRFAAEMDEGDIHQVTVFIWLQLVIALIYDMWLKGIINYGVLLVLRAIHANPDAVDLFHIVVLFFV